MYRSNFLIIVFVLLNELCFPQLFTKITEGYIVNDDRYSEGSSWGDINNDYYQDLFVPDAYSDKTNLLFINNGDGSFTTVTSGPVVTDVSTSSGGCFGDFNNDGHLDLFVQNYFGNNNHFYINQGNGAFSKVTSGVIVSDGGYSFNSSVVDFDNDGNLDIFVDNGAFTGTGENNFLYQGNGDGTFNKIITGDIVNDGEQSLSSGWCDYDEDGDMDLFVANGGTFNYTGINNFLYQNNNDSTFTLITEGIVVNDLGNSTGVSWGDYDNDGDFDLFVANWGGENNFLYENNGNGNFSKISSGIVVSDGGHSVTGAWGDADNDGDLDLFVTNDYNENNCFYENNGDGTFSKIFNGSFVNDGGRSNGATWSDYNNDGFLDLFVPNGQQPGQSNFLYRNNGISEYNWINIICVGVMSNTSAIGTKIRARALIDGQSVWQLRQVSGQTGFNAQNSFNVEFGFADAVVVDSIVIIWPSGILDVYSDVQINKFYKATEGQGLEEIILTSVLNKTEVIDEYILFNNYPNPFNPSTKISWQSPVGSLPDGKAGWQTIKVYDILGKEIATLVDEYRPAGRHEVEFDASLLPSGVYFYQLKTDNYIETKKMLLLK